MKILMLALVTLLVAACGGTPGGGGDGPGGSPDGALAPQEQAAVYLAVMGDSGPGPADPPWISDEVCANAQSAPGSDTGPCEPMDPEVRAALEEAVPGASFTSDPDEVQDRLFKRGGGVMWFLGPIEGEGDEVRVPASYYCGGLCAGGTIHVMELVDGEWTETGSEGPTWMS